LCVVREILQQTADRPISTIQGTQKAMTYVE